jgi:hypothetical protein
VTEVFTNGSEPTHTDTLFRSLQINRESGQLATIFTPPELIESQVFMVVPDEAISWALDAGLSIPPDTYDNIEAPPQVNPNAQIVSPSLFNHVNGKVPIIGRAAGANFDYYRLQVGKGLNPTTWTQLGDDQRNPVGDGQLGVWDTRGLDGLYVLQLLVVQNSNEVETATIQVSVDNQSPQIAIRFPSEGETLDIQGGGTITLEADASDELGVANVEFFIDEEKIVSLNSLPYAFLWEMTVGRHTFTARATDRAGNVAESSIQFSVE